MFYFTSAMDFCSTAATITGASPLTEKPKPSEFLVRCNSTSLGAVQCLLAEKIAIGPKLLKRSFTLYCAKSGGVNDS